MNARDVRALNGRVVRDVMRIEMVTVVPEMTVYELAQTLLEAGIRCVDVSHFQQVVTELNAGRRARSRDDYLHHAQAVFVLRDGDAKRRTHCALDEQLEASERQHAVVRESFPPVDVTLREFSERFSARCA